MPPRNRWRAGLLAAALAGAAGVAASAGAAGSATAARANTVPVASAGGGTAAVVGGGTAAQAGQAGQAAAANDAVFAALRTADARLAGIGYRLAVANAALCDRQEPGLGLVLHTPDQYALGLRAAATRFFRFDGPVGVEAVVAGSPADRAGIRADDTLTAIGTARFAPAVPDAPASTDTAVRVADQVAALPAGQPLAVHGRRDGAAWTRRLTPLPACRSRFEVAVGPGFTARADGAMVQIGSRFLEEYPDEQLAAAVAHELAHNILRHRERLKAVGVDFGMLSGFGRNVRYFRQTELEADILSVALLANAGFDPQAALRFWRDFGPKHAGGILRSRSHPAWTDRVATIAGAIARLGSERPHRPAILAARSRPLDGNWQALLVRAP